MSARRDGKERWQAMTEQGRVRAPFKPWRIVAGVILLLTFVIPTPPCVNATEEDGDDVIESSSAEWSGADANVRPRRGSTRRHRRRRGRRVTAVSDARQKAAQGNWGGEHISLSLTGRGGSFELDCAHGTVDEALAPDGEGKFDVRGSFVRERGGPEIVGERPDSHPARLTGRIDGTRMTLRIVLTGSGEAVGDFSLERGKDPQITKCL
jgi:hypothetical protein